MTPPQAPEGILKSSSIQKTEDGSIVHKRDRKSKNAPSNTHVSFNIAEEKEYEGKKQLSKSRKIKLPIQNFKDVKEGDETCVGHNVNTLSTPIGSTIRAARPATKDELREKRVKQMTIRIFTSRLSTCGEEDKKESGVEFAIRGGQLASVELLLRFMAEAYELPTAIVYELFSLWMVSPLLELQLKPHHIPYECRVSWKKLLTRFIGEDSLKNFEADEPILMFRRNVFLPLQRELEILEQFPKCAEYLSIDTRECLLLNRYNMSALNAAIIAGLTFAMDYGQYDPKVHNAEFIRMNLEDHLPEKLADEISGKLLFGKAIGGMTALEQKLVEMWQELKPLVNQPNMIEKRFLQEVAAASNCYGAAFFYGTIERPSVSTLDTVKLIFQGLTTGVTDVEVRVAINDSWLSVFDLERNETILEQRLEECTWRQNERKNGELYLLLHFAECESPTRLKTKEKKAAPEPVRKRSPNDTDITNVLQIFGSQSVLMETLLTYQINAKLQDTVSSKDAVGERRSADATSTETSPTYPTQTSSSSSSSVSSVIARGPSFSKDNKMCLARFENGRCIDARGSLRKVFVPNVFVAQVAP